MQRLGLFAAPLILAALAIPAAARTNPQIDYAAFRQLTRDLGPVREKHRLAWADFAQAAQAEGALLLDARSAGAFAQGHLKGAVNLPFTDFTAEALQAVIGSNPDRPIYIYCNNNFRDHAPPVALKAAPTALNIPTFINLHAYGYHNVWELAEVIGTADPGVPWEASPQA
jgi:rhodanese-related sulfurtransferase